LKYFNLIESTPFTPVYAVFGTPGTGVANTENDPFIPEIWANESIAILIENLIAANLVHRDFENLIARYGDVINTRKPSEFTAKRKSDYDDVTIQTPDATNVQVKLNQHFHVSFMIKDGEDSMAFKDLVGEYLEPAILAIAQSIDRVILGQHGQFLLSNTYAAGKLGLLSSTTAKDYILDTRKVMNDQKCPATGRNFVIGSGAETNILKADDFTSAEKVGDNGTALREASLGFKLGFNFYMDQNMSDVNNTDINTADTLTEPGLAGATSLTVATVASYAVGDMITVVGDSTPQLITAVNGTTSVITVTPGLKSATADNAVTAIYDAGTIKQATTTVTEGSDGTNTGLRVGWYGDIIIDALQTTSALAVGDQLRIATGASGDTVATAGDIYTVIEVVLSSTANTSTVRLDRPLDTAVIDNALVSFFPSGSYNFAFHRNAVAFVSRPLAMPRAGTGALAATVSYDGIGLRVCITYDGTRQGHLVTVDLLCGVKVLDQQYGAVMYG